MSFDIFLQCFRDKEPATFKRSLVEEIFGPDRGKYEPEFMQIDYSGDGGGDIYLDGEDNQGAMFNHCGGERFFQAMWELADRTQSVIFWPDLPPGVVVTNAETLEHLPDDFLEAFRPVKVVKNGREIGEAIANKESNDR